LLDRTPEVRFWLREEERLSTNLIRVGPWPLIRILSG
jgi:hypothetical protein